MSGTTTSRLRKGAWSEEEDILLRNCIANYGEGKWHLVPVRAGLNRCRKSCRLRWLNYLRPDIKRGDFSSDEVDLIIRLHKLLGNRWSLIAGRLPGRTANDVKNYWNTHLLKKMAAGRELEDDKVKLENKINGGKTTRPKTTAAVIVKPRPWAFSKHGCWKIKNKATTSPETSAKDSTSPPPPPTSVQPDKDSSNTSMQYWLDNLFLNAESDGTTWLSTFGGGSETVENDRPSLCHEEFSNLPQEPEDGNGDCGNHEGQFGSYLFSTDSEFLDLLR